MKVRIKEDFLRDPFVIETIDTIRHIVVSFTYDQNMYLNVSSKFEPLKTESYDKRTFSFYVSERGSFNYRLMKIEKLLPVLIKGSFYIDVQESEFIIDGAWSSSHIFVYDKTLSMPRYLFDSEDRHLKEVFDVMLEWDQTHWFILPEPNTIQFKKNIFKIYAPITAFGIRENLRLAANNIFKYFGIKKYKPMLYFRLYYDNEAKLLFKLIEKEKVLELVNVRSYDSNYTITYKDLTKYIYERYGSYLEDDYEIYVPTVLNL